MNDYEKEYNEPLVISTKKLRGRPKVEGEEKEWDIRVTPVDQREIDFSLFLEDFKILLVCKEGEPNGQPRLHYHMYAVTSRSDSYIDNLLSKMGRATNIIKGNAVYSKRKKHEGTVGYVVKCGVVVCRHGVSDQFITESFKRSEDYRKAKEAERKNASRGKENFLATIMKDAEVKRLTDPESITGYILQKYKEAQIRFPPRSTIESAVMSILFDTRPNDVISYYSPKFFSQY